MKPRKLQVPVVGTEPHQLSSLPFKFPRREFGKKKCRKKIGFATMSGKYAGVVVKVLKEEPKTLYTHCYGHSLSHACGDAIKHSKIMKDSLDTTHEITKLIKKSPHRVTLFEKLKSWPLIHLVLEFFVQQDGQ